MKRIVSGLIIGLLLVGLMFLVLPKAKAAPMYGYKWTSGHGWIVYVTNDLRYTIRSICHWYAGGSRWTWRPYITPHSYRWTTSDAGSWGDNRPRNLSCSYRRV